MQNQSVTIVGGAAGLGLETARLMLAHGARRVALIDKNEAALQAAAGMLQGEVLTAVGDIAHQASAHAAFEQVAQTWGRVDALVNAAAIYPRKDILDITDAD